MTTTRASRAMAAFAAGGDTETVTYRPARGTAREIQALVDRPGRDERTGAATPRFELTVLNDATSGIAAVTLDTGGDQIDVAERAGGTARRRHITEIIEQDDEMLKVQVR